MKTTNFTQINEIDSDLIKLREKKELTLNDIKILLGLKLWATEEDIINEIKYLSK